MAELVQTGDNIQTQTDGQLLNLQELLRSLNKYKWGIISITFAVTLLALLIAFSLTPIYRATVSILIESSISQPISQVENVFDPGVGRGEYYATQFEILRSADLARRTIEKMDLVNHPEFSQEPKNKSAAFLDWRRWLPFLPAPAEKPLSDSEKAKVRLENVVAEFHRRLTVEHVQATQIVKVHFEATSPELAAQVANTLAGLYLETALEGRLSVTQKANSWLTQKVADIRGDLERAEQALQAFREKEQLVNVGGERGLAEAELTDNAVRLREARKATADLASSYAKIKAAGSDPSRLEDVSALLQDGLVESAKKNLQAAQEAVKQLEQRYGPKHPQMIAAKARKDQALSAYRQQLVAAAKGVEAQYEIARSTQGQLSQYEQSARDTIRGLDRKGYQLGTLEREVETNRQLYDMFLTRFKETDISSSYEALTARIVDPAVVPRNPFKPHKLKILFLSIVCGLFLGVLFSVLRSLLSDAVQSSEELEALTGMPLLGALPIVPDLKGKKPAIDLVVTDLKNPFSEGIRSIRTGVVLSDLNKKRKRLVVTSSIPGEGKTTVAINLAMAHGQIEKTLLLEGDLRRPMLASRFGLPKKSPGLTEVLSGDIPLEQSIYAHQEGKIHVLPVGRLPPNPAEILASAGFKQLIETLSARYDRVIIDSAPCHAVSDTYLLAQSCDGLIFVIQAEMASRRMVRSATNHLKKAQVPLLGTVVNQVNLKRQGRYFSVYYQDYGYYA